MNGRSLSDNSSARRSRLTTAGLLILLAGLLGVPSGALAHDAYASAIQHRMQVTVSRRNIDIVIDLTFFEVWSERERRAMDSNHDGRISAPELDAYMRSLASKLTGRLSLRAGRHDLALVPLYDPELDLLGNLHIGPDHHRLRLYFFAPTPADLQADDEIVIEDRLWPEARHLATVAVDGQDGCEVEAKQPEVRENGDHGDHRQDGPAQIFRFRCVKPPTHSSSNSPMS